MCMNPLMLLHVQAHVLPTESINGTGPLLSTDAPGIHGCAGKGTDDARQNLAKLLIPLVGGIVIDHLGPLGRNGRDGAKNEK